jgi:phosphate uptake regulator
MKRKVIKQGHNTLTITLPTTWCQRIGIKEGDEIELSENEDALMIDSQVRESSRSFHMGSKDLERSSLAKTISACYELGLDKITIDLEKDKTNCWYFGEDDFLNTVDYFIERLVGFEITSHTEKKLTIENLSEPLLKFNSVISSLFSMTLEGIQNYIECIENKSHIKRGKSLQNEGEIRHSNISRFTSLGWRILYKYPMHNKASTLNNFTIIHHIDKAGDYMRFAYRDTIIDKNSPSKNLIDIAKKCIEYIEMYRSFYSSYDIKKVNHMENLRGEIKALIKELKKDWEIRAGEHLDSIVECFYGCIKPRIMIEIDREAKSPSKTNF